MKVRMCLRCNMYHEEGTEHLSAEEMLEAPSFLVYKAKSGLKYYSPSYFDQPKEAQTD